MAISFFMYPATNRGDNQWANGGHPAPGTMGAIDFSYIDDPNGSPDAMGTTGWLAARTDGSTYRQAYYSTGLTAPQTGLTGINYVRLHAWLCDGGTAEPVVDIVVNAGLRPGASATYYDSAARTIVSNGSGATGSGSYGVTTLPKWRFNLNSGQGGWGRGSAWAHVYWDFTVNPVTSVAWTVADLQTLLISIWCTGSQGSPGAGTALPPYSGGSANCGLYFTSLYVEVNVNAGASMTEVIRGASSAYLRMVRGGTETVQFSAPPAAADVDEGRIVAISHPKAPDPGGQGWGPLPWQRHHGIVVGEQLDLSAKKVILTVLDGYRFFCGLWFPAVTGLPYTTDGQGIPYLDAGGSRNLARNTICVVPRSVGDYAYQQVPVNSEIWTPDGIGIYRNEMHIMINNCFALGSGTTWTGWTNSGSSGTYTEVTNDYLFDFTGYRRAAQVSEAAANWQGFSQTVASIPNNSAMRVLIISKMKAGTVGGNKHLWRLTCVAGGTTYYWLDSSATWTTTLSNSGELVTEASLGLNVIGWTWSKWIYPPAAGTLSISLLVYVTSAGSSTETELLYYADVYSIGATGTTNLGVGYKPIPFLTQGVAQLQRTDDVLTIASPPTARAADPMRGTLMLKFRALPACSAFTDIPAADWGGLFDLYVASTDRLACWFARSGSDMVIYLRRTIGGSAQTVSVTIPAPAINDQIAVAARWQAADGELGGTNGAFWLAAKNVTQAGAIQTATGANAPSDYSTSNATLYLGNLYTGGYCVDGPLRDIECVPFVLPDNEVYRRTGL